MSKAKVWKTRTIQELPAKKGSVWRLQEAISPSGEVFIGVRKFTIRGEDYIPDRNGLTFSMLDTESLKTVVSLMKEMHQEMKIYNEED